MTHRSEQVLVALHSNLKGSATTKSRVYRDQVYDIKTIPALTLEYGGEELTTILSNQLADWTLYFSVDIYVKEENYSTTVNKIRSEITVALLADTSQGLSFVLDTEEIDLQAPERGFDTEKPTVRQSMNWKIMYRRNITTPE